MRTIAIIARKGGAGKTTVALNLAVAAHRRGLKTVAADSDPQRSLADLLRLRRHGGPQLVETTARDLFALQAASTARGIEALIIDTPAADEEELSNALVLADLSLFVVRPTLIDFYSLARTLKVVRRLRKPALVVLNQAQHPRAGVEPPAVRNALAALELLGLPVSPAILRLRGAYQSSPSRGCSVEEQGDGAAAGEVERLWWGVRQDVFERPAWICATANGPLVDDFPII